jgi:putative flippase GtrA
VATAAAESKKPSRPTWQRAGWWLLAHFWPAIVVGLGTVWILWDRTEHPTAWIVGAVAGVLFLGVWSALWSRARKTGRNLAAALKGVFVALGVVGLVVGVVWLLFAA